MYLWNNYSLSIYSTNQSEFAIYVIAVWLFLHADNAIQVFEFETNPNAIPFN